MFLKVYFTKTLLMWDNTIQLMRNVNASSIKTSLTFDENPLAHSKLFHLV